MPAGLSVAFIYTRERLFFALLQPRRRNLLVETRGICKWLLFVPAVFKETRKSQLREV